MSKQRNTLLAGAAALALIAGSSLAPAQDHTGTSHGSQGGAMQSQNKNEGVGGGAQSGTMRHSAQGRESSGQSGKMSEGAQGQTGRSESGKMGQKAEPGKGAPGKMGGGTQGAQKNAQGAERGHRTERNAQGTERTPRSTAEQGATQTGREKGQRAQETTREQRGNARENRAAERMRQQGGGGTAAETGRNRAAGGTAREGRFEGMQGNAAGANVTLSDEQRTRIRETVIGARGAPRVSRVDFNVVVGTVIPRGRIHVVPVPQTLVQIEPRWRGFLYFIYEDEVVIVNPRNMRIVAVLPA
jgi:hypothetical protein